MKINQFLKDIVVKIITQSLVNFNRIVFLLGIIVILLITTKEILDGNTKENLDNTIIYSAVALYIGTVISLLKHWMENDKLSVELIKDFNNRFHDLSQNLNAICNNVDLDDRSKFKTKNEVLQAYLNLCSEEYYWHLRGRIDYMTWFSWRNGIQNYLKNSEIHDFFVQEKKYNVSYYGIFYSLDIK
ncbi:hypothetical protein CEQ90_19570 [Lewinellaceae bacterium SD302]|nr:hypothetical protein CEQ90_19570 [Lewinellaceae bacterium SD302]